MREYHEADYDERRPVWIALSNLYIDTELQDYTIRHIAKVVHQSPYSVDEIEEINRKEVFPIVYANLLSVAGVWTGFKEEWLLGEIVKRIQSASHFRKVSDKVLYRLLKGMIGDDWQMVMQEVEKISQSE